MSTHNMGFYEDLTYEDLIKIIFQLSSNMHLISSSGLNSCHEEVQQKINGLTSMSYITQFEPRYEKTGFLHMRKQRCRSAPLFSLHR